MQISTLLLTLGVSGTLAGRPVLQTQVPSSSSSSTTSHTSTTTVAAGRPVLGSAPKPTSSSSSVPAGNVAAPAPTTLKTTTLSTSTTSTTSTTPVAASTCSSPLPTYGCLPLTTQSVFVNAILEQHNTYRMRHSAPNMTWSDALVPAALANAQNNADKNVFVHTTNPQWGENIAYQYGYNNPLYLPFLWYDEVRKYNFSSPGYSTTTGHFTQLVWLDSTQLGCAYVQAQNSLPNNGWYYLSCEYNTPGNYAGQYQAKVLPANSQPYPTQPAQYI